MRVTTMKVKKISSLIAIFFFTWLLTPSAFAMVNAEQVIHLHPYLNHHMVKLAFKAYQLANRSGKVKNHNYLTMINFSKCSKYRRLTIIDLHNGNIVMHLLVSQGHNSGLYCAKYFSNQVGSHKTSLGTYVTGYPYYGNDGYSLYLYGLERGINNNVFRRHIVMHGAWYVKPIYAKYDGRIGRTYGCFGLNKRYVHLVIDMLQHGSVIFAYAKPELHDPYLTHPNQQTLLADKDLSSMLALKS